MGGELAGKNPEAILFNYNNLRNIKKIMQQIKEVASKEYNIFNK